MANELRRRKAARDQNAQWSSPANSRRKEAQKAKISLQRSFACLLLSGTLLTLFLLYYVDHIPWYLGYKVADQIAENLGYHRPTKHAVILDAGSTGSRVLAYSFHESIGGYLVLDEEMYQYTDPGLSSYLDDPDKGVQSIKQLLTAAQNAIPDAQWSKTPLILRATAGLRLVEPRKAQQLLTNIKQMFNSSPFLIGENAVAIMDGHDEGIFSWFAVNFLLDLFHADPIQTVAAFDLGGGSTQVTFHIRFPTSLEQKKFIYTASTLFGMHSVYTRSFLGMGLKSARQQILTYHHPEKVQDGSEVTSICLNHIIKRRLFRFGNLSIWVSGPEANYSQSHDSGTQILVPIDIPIVNFEECSALIVKVVQDNVQQLPDELRAKNIFAFSYYFDRAVEAGLIDEATGGRTKISNFEKAARHFCHEANAEQPYMCLDLTFIWVLLEKGFGLKPETVIHLYKKIKGHEITWALGVAFNELKSV